MASPVQSRSASTDASTALATSADDVAILISLKAHSLAVRGVLVSIGTATSALASPREVFQRAVLTGAISIVVSHNHPSGTTDPSYEDTVVTRRLRDAGQILGIPILDHIIVTSDAFLSLKDHHAW